LAAASFKPAAAGLTRERKHAREVHERIYQAILEHRLPPGTKLGEERLAAIFEVSRSRMREIFSRLAHECVVEIFPQRGAFVAMPTPRQARDVFEMRRLIEPASVKRLISTLTSEKLDRLREHHARELDARRRNDTRSVIRLSGEFHMLLADLAGNSAVTRNMRELSTLTCLIISLYDAPTSEACRADEHALLIDSIEVADVASAERIMLAHLDHIESSLHLNPVGEDVDLEAVFAKL
jgi:DNA-binding GntR family transcriptional regulator